MKTDWFGLGNQSKLDYFIFVSEITNTVFVLSHYVRGRDEAYSILKRKFSLLFHSQKPEIFIGQAEYHVSVFTRPQRKE